MVEVFFGIITRQAIRRGTFHSVADLETAIGAYIDGWNERAHPFTWTKSADEIITRAKPSTHRKKTYNTDTRWIHFSPSAVLHLLKALEVVLKPKASPIERRRSKLG